MKLIQLSFPVFFMFVFHSWNAQAQDIASSSAPIEVDVEKAAEMIANGNLLLLDVRTPGEVREGYIEGATNYDILNLVEFKAGVEELDKSEPVMVYCKVGGRSAKAAEYLVENGFLTVYDIKGGILAWKKADKPLKKD